MTSDRLHSDTVGRVANKVGVEGGAYFYVPKYRSSDALTAPEIFWSVYKHFLGMHGIESFIIVEIKGESFHSFLDKKNQIQLTQINFRPPNPNPQKSFFFSSFYEFATFGFD